jgi:hypothetical protein
MVAQSSADPAKAVSASDTGLSGEERVPFRSWAEDYPHDSRAMPPVNREAFRIRALQRANSRSMQEGKAPSIAPKQGRFRDTRALSIRAASAKQEAETAAREHRHTNEAERARLHLQRRGYVIVRATVFGGPIGRWDVAGRECWIPDAELIALAVRKGFVPAAPEHDAAPQTEQPGEEK